MHMKNSTLIRSLIARIEKHIFTRENPENLIFPRPGNIRYLYRYKRTHTYTPIANVLLYMYIIYTCTCAISIFFLFRGVNEFFPRRKADFLSQSPIEYSHERNE